MCKATKHGIKLYECQKDEGHEGAHFFEWNEEENGKVVIYSTFWK